MDTAFAIAVRNALTSFIGRIVLALFTLVVFPVLPTVINFVNDVLGYNLTDAEVLEYARNIAFGIAAMATAWLVNHGLFERTALGVKGVIEAGKTADESDQPGR